jgi:hypothetical protein
LVLSFTNMDDILGSLGFLAIVGVIIASRMRSSYRRLIVLDYQRGVKFKSGAFTEVLGPGSYSVHGKRDRVEIVDMRPQPFLYESLSCVDALKQPLAISLTGEVVVEDARKVFANTREQSNDVVARIPQTVREITSRTILQHPSEMAIAQLKQALVDELQKTYSSLGFKIANLELTELWVEPAGAKLAVGDHLA